MSMILDKVILRACDEGAFTAAESGLLLSATDNYFVHQGGGLEVNRKSDLSELKTACWRYFVEDCQPLSSGHVTEGTELIVRHNERDDGVIVVDSNISQIDLPKPYLLSSFIKSKTLDNDVPMSFKANVVFELSNKCEFGDSNSTIYISSAFAAKYSLFNNSRVRVCVDNGNAEQTNVRRSKRLLESLESDKDTVPSGETASHSQNDRWRCAEVNVIDNVSDFGAAKFSTSNVWAAVSPVMFYNLTKNGRLPASGLVSIQLKHATHNATQHYPTATEVYVSVVLSHAYDANEKFDKLLQTYFFVERYLQAGDVLYLSSADSKLPCGGRKTAGERFFLKVNAIKPEGYSTYLVHPSSVKLFQERTVHSYAPTVCMHDVDGCIDLYPPGLADVVEQLVTILQPVIRLTPHTCRADLRASVLLSGVHGVGKRSVAVAAARILHLHFVEVNCYELQGDTSASTEARIDMACQQAIATAPCVLLLRNVQALGKERDGQTEDSRVVASFSQKLRDFNSLSPDWPIVVIATATKLKDVCVGVHAAFLHNIDMETPVMENRLVALSQLTKTDALAKSVMLKHLAQRTAGMVLADLDALVASAKRNAVNRLRTKYCREDGDAEAVERDILTCGPLLMPDDFATALEHLQASQLDGIGTAKIPNVSWEDIGGLADVKADILDTIQLPIEHPELIAAGLRRSGVLLYGPPGTGKTLLAKAVATECSLNFLSVKGPELLNMYVGQSEENVREVFTRARSAAPCVIFFDELDSLAPNRGRSGDSGGVMDRVVSQLLAELDGLHKSVDVFVIGATNRPDLIDPALIRPGRFDKMLYLGISEDRASQLKVIQALTRKLTLSSDCSLERVVSQCPTNLTGADFYALCADATLNAIKRRIADIESQRQDGEEHVAAVTVSEADFLQALHSLVPSISEAELLRYKLLHSSLVTRT